MQDNQRIRITKKLLQDSLISLLQQESIHKLSIKKICDKAQINRSTFYKYYGSQYDLLEEMENDVLNRINSYLKPDTPDASGGASYEPQRLAKAIGFINEHIDLCRLLLNNNVDPKFPEKLVLSLQSITHLTENQLSDEYSDTERAYTFDFAIGGGFSFIKTWMNKENREPPEEVAKLLSKIVFNLMQPNGGA